MIKLLNKGTLFVIIAMLLLMTTTAFASESGTVEVKGYRDSWEFMTEEEITQQPAHFSVTNVIDTFNVKEIDEGIDEGLIVSPSTTITVLVEGGIMFDVYKLTKINEYKYEYSYDEALPGTGPVKIWIPDESGAVDEYGSPEYVEKTIDLSEIKDYQIDFPIYLPGSSITITEPGDYYVIFRYEAIAGAASAFITVKDNDSQQPETNPQTETESEPSLITATPTNSNVLVNNEEKFFDAYNINGYNYFKLRDLAFVISGSDKQFDVNWDNDKNAIDLVTNQTYTKVGGEMDKGDGISKTGSINTAKIFKDGIEVQLTAYNINGNNYFKLRDIAQAFNIGLTWDNQTSTIVVDTTKDYVAE